MVNITMLFDTASSNNELGIEEQIGHHIGEKDRSFMNNTPLYF